MKKETEAWIVYADENLKSAEVLLQNSLFNACLQNIQQAVEKYLKSLLIEKGIGLIKSHNIRQLINTLAEHQMTITMPEDEIDLIDTVYLPSKYPLMSVLQNIFQIKTSVKNA